MRTQIRARSLAQYSPKMSTLFRQLVTRAGKPPPASAGREIYTFWVGNVLPTSPEDRRKLLQTRSTKVRMVLLLRLMTETRQQTDEAAAMPAADNASAATGDGFVDVVVIRPATAQAGQSMRVTHAGQQFDVPVPYGVQAGQPFQVRLRLPATGPMRTLPASWAQDVAPAGSAGGAAVAPGAAGATLATQAAAGAE